MKSNIEKKVVFLSNNRLYHWRDRNRLLFYVEVERIPKSSEKVTEIALECRKLFKLALSVDKLVLRTPAVTTMHEDQLRKELGFKFKNRKTRGQYFETKRKPILEQKFNRLFKEYDYNIEKMQRHIDYLHEEYANENALFRFIVWFYGHRTRKKEAKAFQKMLDHAAQLKQQSIKFVAV